MKVKKNKCLLGGFPIVDWADNFSEVGYGCDYIRLCYKNNIDKFQYFIDILDLDNSNTGFLRFGGVDYTYQKMKINLGVALTFSVSYSGISVPVFQWVCFDSNTRDLTGYCGKFDVYGSYFRLVDLQFFRKNDFAKFINHYTSEDGYITRYDFRIDYFNKFNHVDVPDPNSILKIHTQSKLDLHYQKYSLTNWGVGSKNTGRYYLRYYDKKEDTNKKGKRILYTDYLCYESVHRLEYQLESAFCRGYTLSRLIGLEDKIYTVLGLENLFNGCTFYSYDVTKEINEYNKGRHIQRFQNSVNKFVNAGYNAFQLLYDSLVNLYGFDSADLQFQEFIDNYLGHEKD